MINSSAQNEVVNPAIAKCECATNPCVNFIRSNTSGKYNKHPDNTNTPHHPKLAHLHGNAPAGHSNASQSFGKIHVHGTRKHNAPICRKSKCVPPIPSLTPNTTHEIP